MSKAPDVPSNPARELYPRTSKRTRPLAVFGARGSGKTCYFASLYGHSSDGVLSLTFSDADTERYLASQWEAYESKAGFPGITALGVPSYLLFDFARGDTGAIWSVEELDHSGELIEGGGHANDEDLRRLVQSWLNGCEGVMVFLDAGTTDAARALARRNEVARLLNILREEAESVRITRPLALVLTKWDEHGRFGDPAQAARLLAEWDGDEASAASDPALRKLLDYLRTVPGYQQIRDTLRNFGRRCKVFLMSAVGTDRVPFRKPTSAFGLLPPLAWLLEQSDEERFAAAEKQAIRQSLAQATATYQALIIEHGIDHGPVRDRIEARVRDLTAVARKRRLLGLGLAAGLAAVLLIVGWLGWSGHAARQYEAYTKFCDSPEGTGDGRADRRLALGRQMLTWHSFVLKRDQIARLQTATLRDEELTRDIAEAGGWKEIEAEIEVVSRLDEATRLTRLRELEQKLVAFGEKWGGRSAGKDWQAQLVSVRAGIEAATGQQTSFDSTCAREKQLEATNPPDHAGLVRLWTTYLKSNPPAGYRAQAEERLQAHQNTHDVHSVNLLARETNKERFTVPACGAFLAQVRAVENELHDPSKHRASLSKIRDSVMGRVDELVYNEAFQALQDAKKSLKVEHLLSARTKLGAYLNDLSVPDAPGLRRPASMRTDAAEVMKWLDSFKDGRDYAMKPGTLVVPKGHLLFNNSFGASSSTGYSLTLAGTVSFDPKASGKMTPGTATKVQGEGESVSVDLAGLTDAPAMSFKPGKAQDLTVTVWRKGFRGWWDVPKVTVSADRFIPAVLAQGIQVKDPKDKELTLTIKFEGAEVPSLPQYRRGR